MTRTEVHLAQQDDTGHDQSADCWCEPGVVVIEGLNIDGEVQLVIVRHCDYVSYSHKYVMMARESSPDWITRMLSEIG